MILCTKYRSRDNGGYDPQIKVIEKKQGAERSAEASSTSEKQILREQIATRAKHPHRYCAREAPVRAEATWDVTAEIPRAIL